MNSFDYTNSSDLQKVNHVTAITLDKLKALIDKLLDTFDLEFADEMQLNTIASILGYELDREDDLEFKKRQLRSAIDSYKAKGTNESIKVLFYNLGLDVDIVPLWTPFFTEDIIIEPPFIYVRSTPAGVEGFADVTVMNPDQQYNIFEEGYIYEG